MYPTHSLRIHDCPIMQRRHDRIVPIAVQATDRPQCHRMGGRDQAAMDRTQPAVVAERQVAVVARDAGHREDEELDAEQRVDDAQVQQENIVRAHLKIRMGNVNRPIWLIKYSKRVH